MRIWQLLSVVLFGSLAAWREFRSIKGDIIFGLIYVYIPITMLILLACVFAFLNYRTYVRSRKLLSFIPVAVAIFFLIVIAMHYKWTQNIDESPTLFIIRTNEIGNDGGSTFYFKKSGHLKGERGDHWVFTTYRGHYYIHRDTVFLQIPLNFPLGRRGILTDTSFRLIDDTVHFEMYKPRQ